MTRTLRVAILECDTPVAPVVEQVGNYGVIFEALLKKGLVAANSSVDFEISKWNVVGNPVYPNPNDIDAFLLSGSKHDAHSDETWIVGLTQYVCGVLRNHKTPVVGICFGHQIIARALGARVGRSDGWEISVEEITLTDAGKALFGQDTLYLQQMHRDVVHEVPKGCVNLGYSPRCAIQGLHMPGRIWSVQAHPEFTEFIMSSVLKVRHETGVFNDEQYADAKSRAGKKTDGENLARGIVKFITESCANSLR